jgi:hypothetical protein
MSLPGFSTQGELFSIAGLSASLFAPTDRYRLFAQVIYPRLVAARPALEPGYCAENGRVGLGTGVDAGGEPAAVPGRGARPASGRGHGSVNETHICRCAWFEALGDGVFS